LAVEDFFGSVAGVEVLPENIKWIIWGPYYMGFTIVFQFQGVSRGFILDGKI